MKNLKWMAAAAVAVGMTACEGPENPDVPHEEELITTLNVTLTPASGQAIVFTYQDLDGDGGDAPVITVDSLEANTTYTGALTLFNEAEDPAEELTQEIFTEAEEHQFFFSSTLSDVVLAYDDQDANGHPLGLQFTLTTGEAGSGEMTIILKHEPNKSAAGVADGDPTEAGGETDIEVTFDLYIK